MRYFDTSFLAPLILSEVTSEPVSDFVAALPPDELAVSDWTRVEYASLLAREVRMGGLDTGRAREAVSRFDTLIRDSFLVLLPDRDDFDCACEWLGHYETGLRAGDALHLAIAGNRGAKAIYSLDKLMISAGRMLGLPTSAGTVVSQDN